MRTIACAATMSAVLSAGTIAAAGNLPPASATDVQPLPLSGSTTPDLAPFPQPASTLRVRDIRIEPPPPTAPIRSAMLKFDVANEGTERLGDIVLEIVIKERPGDASAPLFSDRILAGPFTVKGKVTLEAGYTFRYELLLRNFSSDCSCVAHVDIMSAQPRPAAH
jgi:hypothetical protein